MSPIKVIMGDGLEITLYPWEGASTPDGLHEPFRFRLWQARTEWGPAAYGTTQEEAIAALLNRLQAPEPEAS